MSKQSNDISHRNNDCRSIPVAAMLQPRCGCPPKAFFCSYSDHPPKALPWVWFFPVCQKTDPEHKIKTSKLYNFAMTLFQFGAFLVFCDKLSISGHSVTITLWQWKKISNSCILLKVISDNCKISNLLENATCQHEKN